MGKKLNFLCKLPQKTNSSCVEFFGFIFCFRWEDSEYDRRVEIKCLVFENNEFNRKIRKNFYNQKNEKFPEKIAEFFNLKH